MDPSYKPATFFQGSRALQFAPPRALLNPTTCISVHKAEPTPRLHSLQTDPHVGAAVQPPRNSDRAYLGGAAQASNCTMQPSLPLAEAGGQKLVTLPESTEAMQLPPPPPMALDREAAMKELAAAAGSAAAATHPSSSQSMPPEARESLTALKYLTMPQFDTQAMEIPCKIIFAERSTPIQKQVQVPMQLPHLSVAAREFAAFRILSAVRTLHSLRIVHGDLNLRSIVVTREGGVLVLALESAKFVALDAPSNSSFWAAIKTAKELQADRPSNAKKLLLSEVVPAGELPVPVQPTPNSNDTSAACPLDSKEQLPHESVQLGVLLFQILPGGNFPSDLTEGGNVAATIKASQQGLFRPDEVVPRAAMELEKLGVSERWQACVHTFVHLQHRQTAVQAAATFSPVARSPGDPSENGARG
ncbi:hypothetical protein Emag_003324 [Eimeria magna]